MAGRFSPRGGAPGGERIVGGILAAGVAALLLAACKQQPPDVRRTSAAGTTAELQVPVSELIPGPVVPTAATVKNPYGQDDLAISEGQKLFDWMNCSGCHAPLGGGGMGPPLSDDVWVYGGEPGQIYLSIAQGRPNGMPAWGSRLSPDVIWKIVSYVETLSKPETEPGDAIAPPMPATPDTVGADETRREARPVTRAAGQPIPEQGGTADADTTRAGTGPPSAPVGAQPPAVPGPPAPPGAPPAPPPPGLPAANAAPAAPGAPTPLAAEPTPAPAGPSATPAPSPPAGPPPAPPGAASQQEGAAGA